MRYALALLALAAAVSAAPARAQHVRDALPRNPADSAALARRMAKLEAAGFFARQQRGIGHFIVRATIDEKRPTRLTDLFRGIPGVRVQPTGKLNAPYQIIFRGGASRLSGPCPPRFYLDGNAANVDDAPDSPGLDDLIHPEAVEAIEVYRGAEDAPQQYGGIDAACGIVLIWSRNTR